MLAFSIIRIVKDICVSKDPFRSFHCIMKRSCALSIVFIVSLSDYCAWGWAPSNLSQRHAVPPHRSLLFSPLRRFQQKKNDSKGDNQNAFFSSSTANTEIDLDATDVKYSDSKISKLKRKLSKEFLTIGGPAFCQLAAEPIASLVDTAYLGRLGPHVLGGAGVAVSAQYAIAKLYNDPLLKSSISLVASQDGEARSGSMTEEDQKESQKKLSVAVSSALLLASVIGLVQLIVYTLFSRSIILGMGVSPTSPMWNSALSYLQVRSWGTPAATLWLVSNGIFRGLGDTKTPLWYSFYFTALNIVLDPIFIFGLGWGAAGAAAGTTLAQYAALIPLLLALHRKVPIDIFGQVKELKTSIRAYLKAGSLVFLRSLGKVVAYSLCARQAALLGSVAAAAYNLTFQLGFATTQICEAVSVATQTLVARELADTQTHPPKVRAQLLRHIINTAYWMGGGVATVLSLSTFWRRHWIVQGLTTNTQVQAAATAIFPAVVATQILKGLAYPVNGVIMGGLDWMFSVVAMWLGNLGCFAVLAYCSQVFGAVSLHQVWWALAVFMGANVVADIARYESKTGVWKVLQYEK